MMTVMMVTVIHPIAGLTLALVAVGVLLWALSRIRGGSKSSEDTENSGESEGSEGSGNSNNSGVTSGQGCCGMHIVCERDSLSTGVQDTNDYYDDEELDVYAGRGADEYSAEEIDQFRDVLLTTSPDEIAAWARAIQRRGIELPTAVRDELLLIVSEARAARAREGT